MKSARTERGIKLERFATDQGISKGYLSDIENGKRLPTIDMLDRIATALGVKLKDLF